MNLVKWNDLIQNEPFMYEWVYSKGQLIGTNNRKSRVFALKNYRKRFSKKLDDKNIIRSKGK